MLGSFLSSYPTGSLLTELVQIYNGKYIVKASLQIEAVTRATAMAAAETLETAEDSARQRVITFFAGNESLKLSSNAAIPETVPISVQSAPIQSSSSTDSQHNQNHGVTIETIPVEIKTKPQPASNIAPTNIDNVSNQTSVPIELPPVEEIVAPAKTKTKAEAKSKTTQDLTQLTEVTTKPEKAPDIPSLTQSQTIPDDEPVKEPLFDAYEEFTPSEPQFEPFETSTIPKVSTPPNNVTPFTGRNYNPPEEIELPPVDAIVELPTSTTKRKKKTDTTDQSDDIAKIGIEMQRLGWTTEQGRDYLVKQYGKRSRHLLSPDELRDFRAYLESQSTPEDPLAFDPIAGF
ncbi:hypothetical protein NIES4071_46440 [Calothrix sp. NIES-4071]|nr:hypothetical protein NIES4071_46440 [Calothrix sp. NIES-4071]BAZ58955.1 hypothetical protein NIES4105_46370 [Calothrix sp. NIES-4105]